MVVVIVIGVVGLVVCVVVFGLVVVVVVVIDDDDDVVVFVLSQKHSIQAGTELGQAQLKLGLDFTLIFCRVGFSHLD